MDDPFEIEARGATEGINPMFGEWRQKFNFCPVSYANTGNARANFKQAVRDELKNKFVFVGQVSLTATLYLNEQKILETPAYGDLDNYAKQLLDTLKGSGGILIDDCQV
jgi:Holliday junction resolvase RusA-like endonuclease